MKQPVTKSSRTKVRIPTGGHSATNLTDGVTNLRTCCGGAWLSKSCDSIYRWYGDTRGCDRNRKARFKRWTSLQTCRSFVKLSHWRQRWMKLDFMHTTITWHDVDVTEIKEYVSALVFMQLWVRFFLILPSFRLTLRIPVKADGKFPEALSRHHFFLKLTLACLWAQAW